MSVFNSIPNIDLTPITDSLLNLETKINQIPTTDLSEISTKLDEINSLLILSTSPELIFTPLVLNPELQIFPPTGWTVPPINLENIYDGNQNSSTNLFTPPGGGYSSGEIVLGLGFTTTDLTKIFAKIGVRNIVGFEAVWELGVFSNGNWINVWSYSGPAPSSNDLIFNINIIVDYPISKIKIRLFDIQRYQPQAIIYDLKVFAVS